MAVPGAKVVHHIPGRLRVRLPRLRRDPHLAGRLRDFFSGLGAVQKIDINPVTGSILVHYRPESHGEIQAVLRQAEVLPELTEPGQLAEEIERDTEFLGAHSELAFHVVHAVKALDREIRVASGNTVDLKVLLPATLALWALTKIGAEVATPMWVTLGIFSFNSFVALHHPSPHRG